MNKKVRLIQKRRVFSEDFKRSLVKEFETGQYSVLQLEKLHKIPNVTIYNWIYKYSTFNDSSKRIVEMKNSSSEKLKEYEKRIKELELLIGQKQIKMEYLEKMIELAEVELDIDIKKNFNTPPFSGSGKTKSK